MPEIYQATGIPKDTLYGWRRQALEKQGQTVPASGRGERRWSGQEKFAMVLEAMAMNETERAAYCRQRGIYPEQLQAWQHACEQANGAGKGKPQGVNDAQAERRRTRELERELKRKGRVQRIGQRLDTIRVMNLRYAGTVEDEVYAALSARFQDIFQVLEQLPDSFEENWVAAALQDREAVQHVLNRVELARTPMERRYFRDVADDAGLDWESCERIIASHDIQAYMRSPWR